jgi:hypothetical protein
MAEIKENLSYLQVPQKYRSRTLLKYMTLHKIIARENILLSTLQADLIVLWSSIFGSCTGSTSQATINR